jgi:hypothetical protein
MTTTTAAITQHMGSCRLKTRTQRKFFFLILFFLLKSYYYTVLRSITDLTAYTEFMREREVGYSQTGYLVVRLSVLNNNENSKKKPPNRSCYPRLPVEITRLPVRGVRVYMGVRKPNPYPNPGKTRRFTPGFQLPVMIPS